MAFHTQRERKEVKTDLVPQSCPSNVAKLWNMGYRGVENAHGLESIVNTASSHDTLYGATNVVYYACILNKDLTFLLSLYLKSLS